MEYCFQYNSTIWDPALKFDIKWTCFTLVSEYISANWECRISNSKGYQYHSLELSPYLTFSFNFISNHILRSFLYHK